MSDRKGIYTVRYYLPETDVPECDFEGWVHSLNLVIEDPHIQDFEISNCEGYTREVYIDYTLEADLFPDEIYDILNEQGDIFYDSDGIIYSEIISVD